MQNVPDRPIPAEQWTTAGPIGLNKIKFDLGFQISMTTIITLLLCLVQARQCF